MDYIREVYRLPTQHGSYIPIVVAYYINTCPYNIDWPQVYEPAYWYSTVVLPYKPIELGYYS